MRPLVVGAPSVTKHPIQKLIQVEKAIGPILKVFKYHKWKFVNVPDQFAHGRLHRLDPLVRIPLGKDELDIRVLEVRLDNISSEVARYFDEGLRTSFISTTCIIID